jgi:hypothetical protein
MPRAVSPWKWQRALRDHGPQSQSVRCTLYTISTWMNRDGYAFPSQDKIAKGAQTTTRSVQRHIAEAKREGWIATELAGRGGKGWRFTRYRACVPDHLDLDALDDDIAATIHVQEGGIADDTMVSSPRANGHDTIVSPRPGAASERDDNGRGFVTTDGADGDDKSGTSWRHDTVALTPALRTDAEESHPESITRPESDPVEHLFDVWKGEFNKPTAKLDNTRRTTIRAALKMDYTVNDLERCIRGYKHSRYHMGENKTRTVHDDIELFLRDAKRIDAGLKYAERALVSDDDDPWQRGPSRGILS